MNFIARQEITFHNPKGIRGTVHRNKICIVLYFASTLPSFLLQIGNSHLTTSKVIHTTNSPII